MEEPVADPLQDRSSYQLLLQRDAVLLAILIAFSAGLHAWVIAHTEVAARDSIAFIRYAWQLQHKPLVGVLKSSLHPPLYPATVLAVSMPLRRIYHGPDVLLMQYSAQIASTMAGLLLIIPMFFLGKQLFDRWVGFWSAFLFQCLPVGSRALSDGLTEGLFLLLIATGLLAALAAFRRGSFAAFGLIGVCGGLAYLTRPEGVLLPAATALVLFFSRTAPDIAWTRRRKLACLASLTATALAVSLPYMVVIGGVTNKTTGRWIFEWFTQQASAADVAGRESMPTLARPLVAEFVPDWKEYHHAGNLTGALAAICQETGKSFHYLAWFPALLGLIWFRSLWRTQPGVRVVLILTALHLVLLLRVAVVAGYVSERHTLLLVLCFCPWAIAGTLELVQRVSTWGEQLGLQRRFPAWGRYRPAAEIGALLLFVATGLPGCLKSLHSNRAGHRAAGAWLAEHARPWDEVKDPFCWAHYYSGRVFCEGIDVPVPPGETALEYVVMDTANHHSRIPQLDEARVHIRHGRICFEWPEPATGKRSTVQIYEVPLPTKVAHQ